MKVLAVHTAAARLSIALVDGVRVLLHVTVDEPRDQGNVLLQTVMRGLKDNGLAFGDLDLMAAITGPGSFTGIRIGLAAMRGFALASNVKLVGVDSFALYATLPIATQHRLVVMESWRDELYFKLDDEVPFNVLPQDCVALLAGHGIEMGQITLMGDAASRMQSLLPDAHHVPASPDAAQLAQLVQECPDACGVPEPFYLREADVSFGRANRTVQQET